MCVLFILGSSDGGSLVATPDCEAAVLDSNLAISPAYNGLPVHGWAAIWGMALCCRLSSEGPQKRIQTKGTYVPPKKFKEKKVLLMKKPEVKNLMQVYFIEVRP
jgi:hypothetical protein